jgi:hypothetical protein
MVSYIISTLRKLSVGEQVRLLGSVKNYVKNDNLANLLQNYDINNTTNDKILISQLQAFAGVPGLREQVNAWLSS